MAYTTGAKVYIKRVKLSNFQVSQPVDPGPLLWPLQLVPAAAPAASTLNMSDVWIYVDKGTLEAYRTLISQQQDLLTYSVSSTMFVLSSLCMVSEHGAFRNCMKQKQPGCFAESQLMLSKQQPF